MDDELPTRTRDEQTRVAVIDGGTTRTRLRVWQHGKVVWEEARDLGARDVSQGGRERLQDAVADLAAAARAAAGFDLIVATGMITSNVGLAEVPHLVAPVRYDDLARGIVLREFQGAGQVLCIPGVRTAAPGSSIADIAEADVMRGEESEVVALRGMLGLRGAAAFFHVGSHHKLVRTDDDAILGSATTITGELLDAVMRHTILASSLRQLPAMTNVDRRYWEEGLKVARETGFARAAFCTRLLDQVRGESPDRATSFLLGAAAALDLPILRPVKQLVLYGHATVTEPLADHLRREGVDARVVPKRESDSAATMGAVRLLRTKITNRWEYASG